MYTSDYPFCSFPSHTYTYIYIYSPCYRYQVRVGGAMGQGYLSDATWNVVEDLVENVNDHLKPDRIALITSQDVPELLRDTIIDMNVVSRIGERGGSSAEGSEEGKCAARKAGQLIGRGGGLGPPAGGPGERGCGWSMGLCGHKWSDDRLGWGRQ